jgi:hypothetical protein
MKIGEIYQVQKIFYVYISNTPVTSIAQWNKIVRTAPVRDTILNEHVLLLSCQQATNTEFNLMTFLSLKDIIMFVDIINARALDTKFKSVK